MPGLFERVRMGVYRRPLRDMVSHWYPVRSTRKVDIDETRFQYPPRPSSVYHDNDVQLLMAKYVYRQHFLELKEEVTANEECNQTGA